MSGKWEIRPQAEDVEVVPEAPQGDRDDGEDVPQQRENSRIRQELESVRLELKNVRQEREKERQKQQNIVERNKSRKHSFFTHEI